MEPNPYQAPVTPNPSAPDGSPGPLWKAVLYGVLVDIGGSTVMGMIALFVTATWMGAHGASQADVENFLRNPPSLLTPFGIVTGLLGTAISVLAGFICARTARTRVYKAALASALITAGLSTLMGGVARESAVLTVFVYAISIGAVLCGAWLYERGRTAIGGGMTA